MMNVKQYFSDYKLVLCCNGCNWFRKPSCGNFPNVCPECGGRTDVYTGRYLIQEQSALFSIFKQIDYVDFIVKTE